MDKKPLYEHVLDKMEESILMVICSEEAERKIKGLGEMLRNASDLPDKHRVIARIREMTAKVVAQGDEKRMHGYLVDLEFAIQNS